MRPRAFSLRKFIGQLDPRRHQPVWYVAYGSNIDPRGLQQYLGRVTNRAKYFGRTSFPAPKFVHQDVVLPHQLYFAGASKHWHGAVAFITLPSDPTLATLGRAFLITREQLQLIVGKENGWRYPALPHLKQLGRHRIRMPHDPAGYRYKYNMLLRLTDINGLPAYTLSTSKPLPCSLPQAAYVSRIATGIDQMLPTPTARNAYLTQALRYSHINPHPSALDTLQK